MTAFPLFEDVADPANPGAAPAVDADYLNSVGTAINALETTRITQDAGDNRYILQANAAGFAPAEATDTRLDGLEARMNPLAAAIIFGG